MRCHNLLFAILVFASGAPLGAAPDAVPAATPPSPAATPSAADKKDKKETGQFDIPVPKGMPIHGIKVPHRDENGRLVMVLEAEVANKLDDQHIEMTNLKIDAFDEDGKKIYIELPRSIFNLDTRILVGETHALIRREDFEINGDALEFNMKTRQGTVRGHIKMTILTADKL